jgi:Undecaprenyl-phosphate galactose phosphotransferase WbaP
LYPSVGLNRAEEFRQLTVSTSLVAGLYALILFLTQRGLIYSRSVFGLFVVLALFSVPIARVLVRWLMVRASLWGVRVGVVGHGPITERTAGFLAAHPTLGFKPDIWYRKVTPGGEGVGPWRERDFSTIDAEAALPQFYELDTLILVQEETPYTVLSKLVRVSSRYSFHIMLMPDFPEIGSLWVNPVDLGGVPALKIQNNLASAWQRAQKRVSDLVLSGFVSIFALPVGLLIALAVKLDSRGPVFFVQERIGRGGEPFDMLKFRTMYVDAEQRLEEILTADAQKRAEWEEYQKLSEDPRVTRVGRFLRAFSLDELPQLWNVLNGTMSLVGPRPFFPDQKGLYGYSYETYILVRPGITGIWQVNGRNISSFRQRAEMDEYYVRNWSVWLDLTVLARTPVVVLMRRGAY